MYDLENNYVNINNNSVTTVFNGPLQTRHKIIILATCNNGQTEISDEQKFVSLWRQMAMDGIINIYYSYNNPKVSFAHYEVTVHTKMLWNVTHPTSNHTEGRNRQVIHNSMKNFNSTSTLLPHIKLIIKVIERSTATSAIITRQGIHQTDTWGSLLVINEITYKSVITTNIKGYTYSPFLMLSNRSQKHVHTQQSHSKLHTYSHTPPHRSVACHQTQSGHARLSSSFLVQPTVLVTIEYPLQLIWTRAHTHTYKHETRQRCHYKDSAMDWTTEETWFL
jgi:hypothetical protein